MYTVFVIGNLASGKSTASRYLAAHGGRHIDLDELAKSLYRPGSPLVEALVDAFGEQVLDLDGGIDTKALALSAFATPEATATLNSIVHPAVLQALADQLVEPCGCCLTEPRVLFTVVEVSVAQSFTDAFPLADEIIAITAPYEVREQRAVERGMTASDFERRAAAQPSETELCALASLVIDNSVANDDLFHALDAWLTGHGFSGVADDAQEPLPLEMAQ